jgi:hypothetical protein
MRTAIAILLLAGVARAEDPPPVEGTQVCSDNKGHYLAATREPEHGWTRLFWGDGKKFWHVPPPGGWLSALDFFEPRFPMPTANPNFRGKDMRVYSSAEVDPDKATCKVRCGTKTTNLQLLDADQAQALLKGAAWAPSPQQYRPYALLRDDRGTYFFVDRGFLPGEEKRFRLFVGQKGALKVQKMTNVVSDSEGEIFSTKTGSLRLIIDKAVESVWIAGAKKTQLRRVPVEDNLTMIYNELGVYLGQKMGTPCDDL